MSNKPMGLAARLNKSSAKAPSALTSALTPIAPLIAPLTSAPIAPLTIDTPITDMPVRTFGAWTNGIGTIRDAVMLPNPAPKPKARQVKVSVQNEPVFNKDPLGYITDEDENQCDEDPY